MRKTACERKALHSTNNNNLKKYDAFTHSIIINFPALLHYLLLTYSRGYLFFFSFHINNSFYLIILHFPCSFIYYLHFLPSVFDREKKKNLVKSVFTYIAKFVTWFNVMKFLFRYNISQTNFLRIV